MPKIGRGGTMRKLGRMQGEQRQSGPNCLRYHLPCLVLMQLDGCSRRVPGLCVARGIVSPRLQSLALPPYLESAHR
eukprot:5323594-Alexandrium_andersonii.AAC.1